MCVLFSFFLCYYWVCLSLEIETKMLINWAPITKSIWTIGAATKICLYLYIFIFSATVRVASCYTFFDFWCPRFLFCLRSNTFLPNNMIIRKHISDTLLSVSVFDCCFFWFLVLWLSRKCANRKSIHNIRIVMRTKWIYIKFDRKTRITTTNYKWNWYSFNEIWMFSEIPTFGATLLTVSIKKFSSFVGYLQWNGSKWRALY